MECWEWPPRYDATYRPPNGQEHWFPVRETMDPEEREAAILVRLQQVMQYAWDASPFYRRKWSEAGLEVGDITSLQAFEKVPVVRKEELRADQAAHEPYGDYLCVDPVEVAHVKGTSGTTGRPTAFGVSQRDWISIANAHARVMWGMGIRPHDIVTIGSPLTLYWGSWGAYIGAERLGAAVFPFGAGIAGQSLRTLQWMRQMRSTVFYGTPSYALRLAEVAAENDIDPRSLGLRKMFFSGEPGASVPAIRDRIVDAFDVEVYDSGSMAEVAPWMNLGATSDEPGVFCWQDLVYTEVCEPATMTRTAYGTEGTPVYTTLERTSQPMIRLLSNDLARWEAPDAVRGRTYPFLPKGIYGRLDDMFQIRGENVHPNAIDEVVMRAPGYGGEHRIVISRENVMDELVVQVEFDPDAARLAETAWVGDVSESLRVVLGVGAKVVAVPPRTFERTDFKARRVIDDRDLFASLEERDVVTAVSAPTEADIEHLADRVRAGSHAAIARGLTLVERRTSAASQLLEQLWASSGSAHVIGVTGPAGSGKSTLVMQMAKEYDARGKKVAILAVDPSSAYSGGAILGDRIRMTDLSGREGIYIRSMASRGATGGLSRAVLDGISLLGAAGFDVVILETVGVGQAEVDVISVGHTVVVVSIPGLGDDIQAIKAGLIEIADIHVVNKADRPGADLTVKQLRESLRLAHRQAFSWNVPIVKTIAATGEGVPELLEEAAAHRVWMSEHGGLLEVERRNAATRIRWAAETLVGERLRAGNAEFDRAVDTLLARELEPRAAAADLLAAMKPDPKNYGGHAR